MKSYIDFIESVSKDNKLGNEFVKLLNKFSSNELSNWFIGKGFTVSENECVMVLEKKDGINSNGRTISPLAY